MENKNSDQKIQTLDDIGLKYVTDAINEYLNPKPLGLEAYKNNQDDRVLAYIKATVARVTDYLKTCGISFIHLLKTLEREKCSGRIKNYKVEDLPDKIKITIDMSDLCTRMIYPFKPDYTETYKYVEFNVWR